MCGLIFSRMDGILPGAAKSQAAAETKTGHTPNFMRMLLGVCLAGVMIVFVFVIVIFIDSPPDIPISSAAAAKADIKIQEFTSAIDQGRTGQLQMNESELNGWLAANLAINQSQATEFSSPKPSDAARSNLEWLLDSDIIEAQSLLQDIKVRIEKRSIRLYAIFDIHGKKLLLELDGSPMVVEGYFEMNITGGKLGALPIPSFLLQQLEARIFDSPQNKEYFKMPSGIQDIVIQDGQLHVLSK
jgi:uncharacterized protein YpmS